MLPCSLGHCIKQLLCFTFTTTHDVMTARFPTLVPACSLLHPLMLICLAGHHLNHCEVAPCSQRAPADLTQQSECLCTIFSVQSEQGSSTVHMPVRIDKAHSRDAAAASQGCDTMRSQQMDRRLADSCLLLPGTHFPCFLLLWLLLLLLHLLYVPTFRGCDHCGCSCWLYCACSCCGGCEHYCGSTKYCSCVLLHVRLHSVVAVLPSHAV